MMDGDPQATEKRFALEEKLLIEQYKVELLKEYIEKLRNYIKVLENE